MRARLNEVTTPQQNQMLFGFIDTMTEKPVDLTDKPGAEYR
jgi:hypothetical protein